jgi:hypothetical protein
MKKCLGLAALMVIAALSSQGIATGKTAGFPPAIASPQMNYLGMSYGDWGAAWQQWAFSLPFTGHPLFNGDPAGGQQGKVWFLGGNWWPNSGSPPGGVVTRSLTIPSGTSLFFPIVNAGQEPVELPGYTIPQMRAVAGDWLNAMTDDNLYATIDGHEIRCLTRYRAISPVFTLHLPEQDNVFQGWGLETPSTTVEPTVADGFYLMVAPLPVGQHTITFGVKNLGWSMDLVYEITVQR